MHRHSPYQEQKSRITRHSTWTSIGVNLILTIAQMLIGWTAHSQGLIADGLHSLSDLLSDVVVLFIVSVSHKGPDEAHPYGHQRFETAGSLLLGLLLMGAGVSIFWSVFMKLQDGTPVQPIHSSALVMALMALLVKELLFRYMLHQAQKVKSKILIANAWHARSDAASSLVASVGIIGNLLGYPILDSVAALIVGLMITRMGWHFAWDALSDLMDRAADREEVQAIERTLKKTPGVLGVHEVRTRKMGDMILVDAHIEVDATITVEEGHAIGVEARKRVMEHHRVLDLMTHIDPASRPDHDHDHE